MTQIFKEAIAQVQRAYPSVYSKEDVIKLISSIQGAVESENKPQIHPQKLYNKIHTNVGALLKNVDYESLVELNIGYNNQIEIDFSHQDLLENIMGEIDEILHDEITAHEE